MSAPHVTGAIGLIASKYPQATPQQLKRAILEGANKNINPFPTPYEDKCNRIINAVKKRLDEAVEAERMTQESADIRLEQIEKNIPEGLNDYKQLDNTGKLSKYGFLEAAPVVIHSLLRDFLFWQVSL